MARYTVHIPANSDASLPDFRAEAFERAIFVRDGWSWSAFALGPLWLLWHRHWITGILMLVVTVLVLIGVSMIPIADEAKFGTVFMVMFLFGLEGSSLRRLALARAGFSEEGLVVGTDIDALEQRFFAQTGGAVPAAPSMGPPSGVLVTGPGQTGASSSGLPVIGLFPDPIKHSPDPRKPS